MVDIDDICNIGYHFTLERTTLDCDYVPEVNIPEDDLLYFSPEEMIALRQFYKTCGRYESFESYMDFNPDSYDECWWAMLEYLYRNSHVSSEYITEDLLAKKCSLSSPVVEDMLMKDATLYELSEKMPYNLDDYNIIAPKELIDDVLDDNFTDWKGILNEMDMIKALLAAGEEV